MSKRLAGYDYSQPGYYLITICTQYHRLIFGTIVDAQLSLRAPGQIADSVWMTLPRRFAHVKLDEYVFMPNHMHGIIQLTDFNTTPAARASLWEIVRVFKAASSYHIRRAPGQPWFAWQDEYYDSVLRTEKGLAKARQYILDNPLRWAQDKFYKPY